MSSFQKPSSGSMSKKSDKTIEFSSHSLDSIVSPYQGVVTTVSTTDCGGKIKIKHRFNEKDLYSQFCNVPTILVAKGETVNGGEKVGKFGSNPIEYALSDGSMNLDTKNFFGKSEKTNEKKPNKENNKQDSYSTDFSKNPELTVAHKMALDAIGLPLTIAKDLVGDIVKPVRDMAKGLPSKLFPKGKNESYDISLNEQIERIKNLMK
jgi:hypothetical protein